jgi:SAM-dependent methyltransferase
VPEPAVNQLPVPPPEFRRLVGPTGPEPFDNPTGALVFPDLPLEAYQAVFDFGCGCGRIARQLIQQRPAPARYLGVDPHRGMVEWCRTHLAPHAPGFEFRHHDVFQEFVNPDGQLDTLPLPVDDNAVTLFIAWSVFTHLLQADAAFYLAELGRVLSPSGVAVTTWFLFDKREFPMMQAFQNALFINEFDPTNAVLFDRAWLRDQAGVNGLTITRVVPPLIRGYQWTIELRKARDGDSHAAFVEDLAPYGLARPPAG